MIAREGWPFVFAAVIVGLILSGSIIMIPGVPQWLEIILVPLMLPGLGLMVAYFFRDPERRSPTNADSFILAPADGKIVEVVQEEEALYIGGQAWRVSIFLSVLDVHINRIPVSGVVMYLDYKRGKYRVAWHPLASTQNEQSHIGVQHLNGTRILFKQIAGRLARRISYRLSEGDHVQAGERFGLIRFGSRMDVLVPSDLHVHVKVGDRVCAGETVIGAMQLT